MTDMHTSLEQAKTLGEVKQIVGSMLDIQNKMVSCASSDVSPHLNDDYPLGNYAKDDEISIKRNFVLARTALDMGADEAYMNYIHENNELANITRGRFGFQNKIMRSSISTSTASIKEDTGKSWGFGRNKGEQQP